MIWNLVAVALSYVAVPALLPIYGRRKTRNYLGEEVPTGVGYAFILPSALVIVLRSGAESQSLLFTIVLLAFAALGAIDDAWGSQSQKGFRGHLAAGEVSTGLLKAVGGGATALAAASLLATGWLELVINGGLVALAANFLNLLDLRPGRAGKAFLLLGLPLHFLAADPAPLQVLSLAVAGYLPWDLRRRAMMGDTGANPLGAALGLMAAGSLTLGVKAALLAALAGLNLLSERISFSELIEGSRILHFLDQLGR